MSFRVGLPLAVTVLCLYRPLILIADAPATQQSEVVHAQRVIRQLADPDPELRREASLQLNSLGADALEVVEQALREDPSPERQQRLRVAVKILRPRAAAERRLRRRLQWEQELFRSAYDHGGHTDASWDAAARKAADLYLKLGTDPPRGPGLLRQAALAAFKEAAQRGCRDPMIMALYQLTAGPPFGYRMGPLPPDVRNLILGHPDKHYPAVVNLVITADYIHESDPVIFFNTRQLPAMLLPDVAKTPGLPPRELDALAHRAFDALEIMHHDPRRSAARLVQAYRQVALNTVGPLLLEAQLLIHDADDQRALDEPDGPGFWATQQKALKQAESVLLDAQKIDPTDVRVAAVMLRVKYLSVADPQGPAEFEKWFRRAVELDPDNAALYQLKLSYLSPPWQGNEEQMLQFGRECLQRENWRSGAPMILIGVHERLASESPDTQEYFSKPDVWLDVQRVYEGYLLSFPNDLERRCEFAKYAAKCGNWLVADQQFKVIGENFDPTVFASRTSYDYLREKAARLTPAATRPSDHP